MGIIFEGKHIIKAPIQKVWDSMFDLDMITACVPGCEKVEMIDEKTYDSIVSAQVGPVTARFQSTTRLVEVDPPRHIKAVGKGKDLNKAGNFKQETVVDLKEISEDEVEIAYRSDVSIVGRLATFGDRIMIAKARQVEKEVLDAYNKRLSGEKATAAKIEVGIWELLIAFIGGIWVKIMNAFKG